MSKIIMIAAISNNFVIGKDNTIPWKPLKKDFKHFKEKTIGKPVIMGRKTWESLPPNPKYKPLPERTNVVISTKRRNELGLPEEVMLFPWTEKALEFFHNQNTPEVCIIGGQKLYEGMLPVFASELFLTRVDTTIENGTAFFPSSFERWFEIVPTDTVTVTDEHTPYKIEHWVRKSVNL